MEGFEAVGAKAYVGHKDRVPEFTSFTRVRIVSWVEGQQIPGCTTEYLSCAGVNEVTVSDREIAKIKAMIETEPGRIDQAKDQYERDIDDELVKRSAGRLTHDSVRESRIRYAKAPATATRADVELAADRVKLEATTGHSWQRAFHLANHRGVRPFLSMEIIGTGLVHPEEAKKQRFTAEQAAMSAKMLAEAMHTVGVVLPTGGRSAKA